MTKEEIIRMMDDKCVIAKVCFYTWMACAKKIEPNICNYSEDDIATLCYNGTIYGMKRILDNSEFFENKCGIKEKDREHIRWDLERMSTIDYPDDYKGWEFKYLERIMLPIRDEE